MIAVAAINAADGIDAATGRARAQALDKVRGRYFTAGAAEDEGNKEDDEGSLFSSGTATLSTRSRLHAETSVETRSRQERAVDAVSEHSWGRRRLRRDLRKC